MKKDVLSAKIAVLQNAVDLNCFLGPGRGLI
jgi:hypothetical protein